MIGRFVGALIYDWTRRKGGGFGGGLCFAVIGRTEKGRSRWLVVLCCDLSRRKGAGPDHDHRGSVVGGGRVQPSLLL